jgi:hypothetical protein
MKGVKISIDNMSKEEDGFTNLRQKIYLALHPRMMVSGISADWKCSPSIVI